MLTKMVRFCCIISIVIPLLQGFAAQKEHSYYDPTIADVIGDSFLVHKETPSRPERLEQNQSLDSQPPYTLVTSIESFLEISTTSYKKPFVMRLGQSTGLEIRTPHNFFLFKGSVLLADLGENHWSFESNLSKVSIYGSGTFIIESTSVGFKIIILEGSFTIKKNSTDEYFLGSGDLALVTGQDGQISQSLQIELPLLLSTSRLVTIFPQQLLTHSRLISAAQVQVMRMKNKYDAFIGGVSEDRKLRIWKVNSPNSDENE